jgi:uncharacterized protein YkwD
MKKSFLLLSILLISINIQAQSLTQEEKHLYDLIMKYRKELKLPEIPLSKSLTFVAQTHVKDLKENKPEKGECNMHSWSSKGKWTECCYTDDHAQAECMWDKPREMTSYKGNGFEISYWSSAGATADEALKSWKNSPHHNDVIINKDIWKDKWNAIGIGIFENHAAVWFGNEIDDVK